MRRAPLHKGAEIGVAQNRSAVGLRHPWDVTNGMLQALMSAIEFLRI